MKTLPRFHAFTLLLLLASSASFAEVNSAVDHISYSGNGTTKTFTFPFGVFATTELEVILRTDATGAEDPQTLNSGYTMTDDDSDGDYWDGPGGSVTFVAAPASSVTVWIQRTPTLTQTTNIDGSAYVRLSALEDAFDKLVCQIQFLRGLLWRVPIVGATERQVYDMNLPAWTGDAGYLYRNGDGEMVYANPVTLGDANATTAWVNVLEGDANGVERLAAKEDLGVDIVVDVRDYGATGDGVTDDGPAIQAAITAAPSGSIVFFPPPESSYNVLTPIEPKSYIHYLGGGRRYCLLKADNNNTDAIFKGTGGKFSNTVWTGLGFRSSSADAYAFKATALNAYVDNLTMRDCEFYDEFHTDFYGTLANSTFERTRFGYLGNGPYTVHRHIYSGDETDSKAVFTNTFRGCWFYNAAGAEAAVWFYGGNTLQFDSCIWQACACPALRVEGIRNTWLQNCDFEDIEPNVVSTNNGMVEVYADSTGVPGLITFQNCWVQNNGASNDEPWTAWAYLTTSGNDAKAQFNQCSGNMGNGYWTKTGSTLDYAQNTTVVYSNPVNNSSSFGSSYSIGRQATFWKGMYVRNETASPGFIRMYENADDGDNYTTLTAQKTDANETMYPIYTRVVDINNAEIKAWNTPMELVPAPGSGRLVEIMTVTWALNYSGGALAEPAAPDDLSIEYDNGSGAVIATFDTTGFITATADAIAITYAANIGDGAAAVTAAANVNKNVVVLNTGTNYTGAGSTSTIRAIVKYQIHDSLGL